MNASLFPGQGSQVPGMGADLFGAFPDHVAEADGILGYSVAELCAERPEKRLRQTEFAQPALYVVGALSHLKRAEAPAAVAGRPPVRPAKSRRASSMKFIASCP